MWSFERGAAEVVPVSPVLVYNFIFLFVCFVKVLQTLLALIKSL
jgi:hypothetical protein